MSLEYCSYGIKSVCIGVLGLHGVYEENQLCACLCVWLSQHFHRICDGPLKMDLCRP